MLNHFPQVIGVASGKGGVGKTTVSVNLAVALAERGHEVMLLDADLGLANVQIALGVQSPYNLSHVLRGEKTLNEVIVKTRSGVRLVPGASGVRQMAALDTTRIAAIINAFGEIQDRVDYLVVDVAAGLSPPVLSFLAACQRRIVVLCDQPAAIADAYGLIKVMMTEDHLDEIYMVANLVANLPEGEHLFRRMNEVCSRFLKQPIQYLTGIRTHDAFLEAARKYQSILEYSPTSTGAGDFRRLAELIIDLPKIEQPTGRVQFFMERMLQATLHK
jgi:flagellar biosynthesis protein FlhG